jgi:predicted RNase H-like HicB family nuclease
MKNRFPIAIFYSEEDEGHIAVVPDLSGCIAFGKDEEQAHAEIKTAINLWIETAISEGRKIPEPSGQVLLEKVISCQKVMAP